MIFVMNRVKREKSYQTGKIREQVPLTKREKGLSLIKVLGIIIEISLEINIKEHILKIRIKDMPNNFVKNNEHKEPIKCQEFQGPHYAKYCPNRKENFSNMHTIQEEETMGDVANEMPRIKATMENRQADHQTSIVEVQGMIQNQLVSILIEPSASLICLSPNIVEKCNLYLKIFEKSWLLQLATGTKREVVNYVKSCEMFMSQFKTKVKVNVLSLGSYDVLIGMDWLK